MIWEKMQETIESWKPSEETISMKKELCQMLLINPIRRGCKQTAKFRKLYIISDNDEIRFYRAMWEVKNLIRMELRENERREIGDFKFIMRKTKQTDNKRKKINSNSSRARLQWRWFNNFFIYLILFPFPPFLRYVTLRRRVISLNLNLQ